MGSCLRGWLPFAARPFVRLPAASASALNVIGGAAEEAALGTRPLRYAHAKTLGACGARRPRQHPDDFARREAFSRSTARRPRRTPRRAHASAMQSPLACGTTATATATPWSRDLLLTADASAAIFRAKRTCSGRTEPAAVDRGAPGCPEESKKARSKRQLRPGLLFGDYFDAGDEVKDSSRC